MSRKSTSAVGALHPVFFMLLVYIISIVLAFFVCRIIYFSLNSQANNSKVDLDKIGPVTALR